MESLLRRAAEATYDAENAAAQDGNEEILHLIKIAADALSEAVTKLT